MLGRLMVGALLVLVGVTSFLWGGVALLIERTDPAYSATPTPLPGDTTLLLIGLTLTLAGGIVLLLSPARRLA